MRNLTNNMGIEGDLMLRSLSHQNILNSSTTSNSNCSIDIRGNDGSEDRSNLLRRVDPGGGGGNGVSTGGAGQDVAMMDPLIRDHAFQQQLIQLKQEQELQHQVLLQSYEAQRQQLAQVHEKQLQQRLKEFYDHKRRQEEERDKLEALKKKEKHEESAVASSEVKQKLQGFLLKKQREAAASGSATNVNQPPGAPYWAQANGEIRVGGGGAEGSNPYRTPLMLAKYEDFPLRKTASEPDLKRRLKQRVLERRSSPLVRRKDRYIKKRSGLAMDGNGSAGSTPDSGPNSPPIGNAATAQSGSGGATPHEDQNAGPGGASGGGSPYSHGGHHWTAAGPASSPSVTDLTLYSSPSLPNISLGKPIPSQPDSKLAAVSETEVRFLPTIPIGSTTTTAGALGMLPPFYPPPHAILDPAELEELYRTGNYMALASYHAEAAEAQSRLMAAHAAAGAGPIPVVTAPGRTIHRPLGRTQSAPLPLGHPMLVMTPAAAAAAAVAAQAAAAAAAAGGGAPPLDPQQAHQLLRHHIRQTVLTRAGSRGQVVNPLSRTESVEEDAGENENEMSESEPNEGSSTNNIPGVVLPPASAVPIRLHHTIRPLSRALSSPLVALGSTSPQQMMHDSQHYGKGNGHGTGIAFDTLMLKHQCLCGDNSQHPEHPGRLQSIWARLQETGLAAMCERIRTRKATLEEIQSCHSEAHTLLFGTNPLSRQRLELSRFPESSLPIKSLVRLPCNGIGIDSDTTWNELHTPSAARMAVGCVLELSFRVATGDLKNGFAVVRPPGHHAEPVQAMGFCFFNSIAIAAANLRNKLNLDKIMILDWDVHHGNGTQQIFYDDPHVLYLSIHRHDEGNFFPGTGGLQECGVEDGMGFNVNVGWSGGLNPPLGDAEYLAVFRTIVMPIAQDFQPDIILVSCGFDAASGHPAPLGGYNLSASCFGWMTQQLLSLTHGKVVLVLEGGYDLPAICDSAQECVRALLGEPVTPIKDAELQRPPCANAIDTLHRVINIQSPHWPCIKRFVSLVNCSALEAQAADVTRVDNETVSAMASLSVHQRSFIDSSRSSSSSNPPSRSASERVLNKAARSIDDSGEDRDLNEEPMEEDDK